MRFGSHELEIYTVQFEQFGKWQNYRCYYGKDGERRSREVLALLSLQNSNKRWQVIAK